MAKLDNVEKANESNLLWPPIADAVDTFLRRRASKGEGYEKIWRLIHVWEAIVATLSSIAVARLREIDSAKQTYRKCREYLHGHSWDELSKSFSNYRGALDGSAIKRLDILKELASYESSESYFILSLRTFLLSPSIDLSKLVSAWARVCKVSDDAQKSEGFQVHNAMKHINTFRNRFAHIPFPYDGLEDIADALEGITEQLFTIASEQWKDSPNEKVESPLTGTIHWGDQLLRGSMHLAAQNQPTDHPICVFPATPKENIAPEEWDCQPFIFIDSMLRPYILTQLVSASTGRWEYTRFRAEANSVIQREDLKWLNLIPSPTEAEYRTDESTKEEKEEENLVASVTGTSGPNSSPTLANPRPINEFEEALRQIRNNEYEPAIDYFARLVKARPEYHIGWLRLGHAQRELAVRARVSEPEKARELFEESINSLTQAAKHLDSNRKAQALYERSKTYYHWGRFTDDTTVLSKALSDVEQAYAISADTTYESWIDYLKRNAPNVLPA